MKHDGREDIGVFIDKFQKYVDILNLEKGTAKNIFVAGLNGRLREDLMLNWPVSLEEAYERAKLKHLVEKNTSEEKKVEFRQILESVRKQENIDKEINLEMDTTNTRNGQTNKYGKGEASNYKRKRIIRCYNCGRKGHIRRICWINKKLSTSNSKSNIDGRRQTKTPASKTTRIRNVNGNNITIPQTVGRQRIQFTEVEHRGIWETKRKKIDRRYHKPWNYIKFEHFRQTKKNGSRLRNTPYNREDKVHITRKNKQFTER